MRLVVAIHAITSTPPPLVLREMVLFTNCLEITLSSRLRSHTRSKMVLCPLHYLSLPRCAIRGSVCRKKPTIFIHLIHNTLMPIPLSFPMYNRRVQEAV